MIEHRPKNLNIYSMIATVYPIGFIAKAPGTWGSIPGLFVGIGFFRWSEILFDQPLMKFQFAIIAIIIMILIALLCIHKTETSWQCHDDKCIVIDEVVGQAIPIIFFGDHLGYLMLSFVLFRFFDILKPGPIGWADRQLPGAFGTLIDDVIAGFTVAVIWWILSLLGLNFNS